MYRRGMKRTKTEHVTYLGVPADVWEYRRGGPMGERVVATKWLGDCPKNDGWTVASTRCTVWSWKRR